MKSENENQKMNAEIHGSTLVSGNGEIAHINKIFPT